MPGRVLVVDDEADTVSTVKMILESEGYNVITASNGEEALRKVEAELPDLIFMDKQMPGKT